MDAYGFMTDAHRCIGSIASKASIASKQSSKGVLGRGACRPHREGHRRRRVAWGRPWGLGGVRAHTTRATAAAVGPGGPSKGEV